MHPEEMLHLLAHVLKDTLLALPILYLVYLLLEWLQRRFSADVLYKKGSGGAGVFFGALSGLLPQCGFSAAAAALYNEGAIGSGVLFAVFFATSDEAFPILLSNPEHYGDLLLLLGFKLIFGVLFGYLFTLLFFKKERFSVSASKEGQAHSHHHREDHCDHEHRLDPQREGHSVACDLDAARTTGHPCEDSHLEEHTCSCGHEHPVPKKETDFSCGCGCCKSRSVFLSALIHTLKIGGLLFVSLFFVELVLQLLGEDLLGRILLANGPFQPLLAGLIGLIPGCAPSVCITEFYLAGQISFGACLSGLSVSAGFGIPVLLGCRVRRKKGLVVLLLLFLSALFAGYLADFLFHLF